MKKLLVQLVFVLALAISAFAQAPLQYRVDDVADLQAITLYGSDAKVTAWVGGRTTRNDGGGGVFYYNGLSSVSTNTYMVFDALNNAGAGRWFKLPTQVANQNTQVAIGNDPTYAWSLIYTNQTNVFSIGNDNANVYLQTWAGRELYINNEGDSAVVIGTNGANVGIGVVPTVALTVARSTAGNYIASFENSNTGGDGVNISTAATSAARIAFRVVTGAAEGLTVDGAANVGFGTLTPNAKVDVNGTLNVTNVSALVGGLRVGNGTTFPAALSNVVAVLTTNAVLTIGQVDAITTKDVTLNLNGVGTNDFVTASPPRDFVANVGFAGGFCATTNVVTLRFINPTAGNITPTAAQVWRVLVHKLQY